MATRGRPLGSKNHIEPNNPDDKMATRGYVKCIARTVHNHYHVKDASYTATLVSAFIAWCAIFCVWMITLLSTPSNPVSSHLPEWAYWLLIAFAMVETITLYDLNETAGDKTYDAEGKGIDKYIKKYEKPEEKEC
jgi:hypothetical protein